MRARVLFISIVLLAALTSVSAAAQPPSDPTAAPGRMRLYVSNSEGDDITVVDLTSFKVVDDIKVGKEPHGMAVEADGRRLFTTIESEHNLKVIDTSSDRVIATIPLVGRPNQCAVTPDGRYVAVPIRNGGVVEIVDAREEKVVKQLPLKVPHNCYDADSNRDIFCESMGRDLVNEISLGAMSYIAQIPVSGIPRPFAVTHDQKTMFVQISGLHGFVVADIPERKVVQTVDLPPAPPGAVPFEENTPSHGMELAPDGKELWVAGSVDDAVFVYDVATRRLLHRIPVGKSPLWVTFTPDGRYCCVSNAAGNDVSIVDTKTHREVSRIKVGKVPKRLVAAMVP